jgi:hypothetical protein
MPQQLFKRQNQWEEITLAARRKATEIKEKRTGPDLQFMTTIFAGRGKRLCVDSQGDHWGPYWDAGVGHASLDQPRLHGREYILNGAPAGLTCADQRITVT